MVLFFVLQAPGSDDPAKHPGYEKPPRDSQRQREHLRIHAGNRLIQRVLKIYRRPGFLAYDSAPRRKPLPHLSRQSFSLYQSSCVSPVEFTDMKEGQDGRGAKSYDGEKAWSSINHSILSAELPPSSVQQARWLSVCLLTVFMWYGNIQLCKTDMKFFSYRFCKRHKACTIFKTRSLAFIGKKLI